MSLNDKNWKNKTHTMVAEFVEDMMAAEKQGNRVPVSDVRIGDEIITRWDKMGRVQKTKSVEDRTPCTGGNGMHVHLNKTDCYDSRSYVWVI